MKLKLTILINFLFLSISCQSQKTDKMTGSNLINENIKQGKNIFLTNKEISENINVLNMGEPYLEANQKFRVDINSSISFVNCTFKNGILFSITNPKGQYSTTFYKNINFINCTFFEEVNFKNSIIQGNVNFDKCTFNKKIILEDCTFFSDCIFLNNTFNEEVRVQNTVFNRKSIFTESTFEKNANFQNCNFNVKADFNAVNFNKYADFSLATFNDNAYFNYTKFNDRGTFNDANFKARADFGNAYFLNIEMQNCYFYAQAVFVQINVGNLLDLSNSIFYTNSPKLEGSQNKQKIKSDNLKLIKAEIINKL